MNNNYMLNMARHILANVQALHGMAAEAAERGSYSEAAALRQRADSISTVAHHAAGTYDCGQACERGLLLLRAAEGYSTIY